MENNEPILPESDGSEPSYVDPVLALLLPKPQMPSEQYFQTNKSDTEDRGCCAHFDNACCSMVSRWWNVRYKWQREVVHVVEQPIFHITIIVLVLLDCFFIVSGLMLDFILLKKPCEQKPHGHTTSHHDDVMSERIEQAAEILEYCSLVLLTIFIIEVLMKIFAFGRHWWNFHKKLFEWFDAIVVISSFVIDLINIHKKNFFTGVPLLFISLRLWRFVSYLL